MIRHVCMFIRRYRNTNKSTYYTVLAYIRTYGERKREREAEVGAGREREKEFNKKKYIVLCMSE